MKGPLRVLIVDDSEDDVLFLMRELERGSLDPAFRRVESLPGLTSALDSQSWDLIICDYSLPGFNSSHVLALFKQRRLDIPFIVVSGIIGEDVAVKAIKAGASDYVMKNDLSRLAPSIERELREGQCRRARREAEEALQRNERELNDFFEHAPVGLQWVGPDGIIMRVNEAELDLMGYNQEEYVGHHIPEFHADRGVADDLLRRLHIGETLDDFEARLRCRSGEIKHVIINGNVLRENGRFVRTRCFTRDITARKRGEEERFRLISELTESLAKIKTLNGLPPICCSCKKIRDNGGYWHKIESYISGHTQAEFTHGICPDCMETLYPEYPQHAQTSCPV